MNDWLGTRRVTTNYAGVVEQTCASRPYGDGLNCTGSLDTPNEQHFTGKIHDSESGLDNFGARYYSSNDARFMSPDWNSDPQAVPYADLSDPQSLNLYGYMRDNPLGGVDQDGHCTSGGNHESWWWCLWNYSKSDQYRQQNLNEARNFFNNNDVIDGNGNRIDPSKMSSQQLLAAWKQYNDEYRTSGGAVSPNAALSGMLPGAGLKYEASPKHGKTARGNASPAPTNPEQTLENSVPIKNSSEARVGVDPSTGEYVMFRETSPGVYHGYATHNFNDLPNDAKAALQRAGMVSQRGKIQ